MQEEKRLSDEELRDMFVTYKDTVYGYLFSRLGNAHDAEDLFSKTFVKFYRYAQKKPVRLKTVKSFLFRIAANTLNDHFRRARIVRFVSMDRSVGEDSRETFHDLLEDPRSASGFKRIDHEQALEKLKKEVTRLPEKQKQAFHLRFIEGLSFAEIAETQSTTVSTALSRVRYAVLKVRDALKDEWED